MTEVAMRALKVEESKRSEADAGLYDADYYSWAVQQAAALRAGDLTAIDRLNLAEEVEDLARNQFDKMESALRLILLHMSKWDRQPGRRSRSWVLTIEREREEFVDVLRDNRGLKPRQTEALERAYRKARLEAMNETGLPRSSFPSECPYDLGEVLQRPIEWPEI